jgi:hypothetical protein
MGRSPFRPKTLRPRLSPGLPFSESPPASVVYTASANCGGESSQARSAFLSLAVSNPFGDRRLMARVRASRTSTVAASICSLARSSFLRASCVQARRIAVVPETSGDGCSEDTTVRLQAGRHGSRRARLVVPCRFAVQTEALETSSARGGSKYDAGHRICGCGGTRFAQLDGIAARHSDSSSPVGSGVEPRLPLVGGYRCENLSRRDRDGELYGWKTGERPMCANRLRRVPRSQRVGRTLPSGIIGLALTPAGADVLYSPMHVSKIFTHRCLGQDEVVVLLSFLFRAYILLLYC